MTEAVAVIDSIGRVHCPFCGRVNADRYAIRRGAIRLQCKNSRCRRYFWASSGQLDRGIGLRVESI